MTPWKLPFVHLLGIIVDYRWPVFWEITISIKLLFATKITINIQPDCELIFDKHMCKPLFVVLKEKMQLQQRPFVRVGRAHM